MVCLKYGQTCYGGAPGGDGGGCHGINGPYGHAHFCCPQSSQVIQAIPTEGDALAHTLLAQSQYQHQSYSQPVPLHPSFSYIFII